MPAVEHLNKSFGFVPISIDLGGNDLCNQSIVIDRNVESLVDCHDRQCEDAERVDQGAISQAGPGIRDRAIAAEDVLASLAPGCWSWVNSGDRAGDMPASRIPLCPRKRARVADLPSKM